MISPLYNLLELCQETRPLTYLQDAICEFIAVLVYATPKKLRLNFALHVLTEIRICKIQFRIDTITVDFPLQISSNNSFTFPANIPMH